MNRIKNKKGISWTEPKKSPMAYKNSFLWVLAIALIGGIIFLGKDIFKGLSGGINSIFGGDEPISEDTTEQKSFDDAIKSVDKLKVEIEKKVKTLPNTWKSKDGYYTLNEREAQEISDTIYNELIKFDTDWVAVFNAFSQLSKLDIDKVIAAWGVKRCDKTGWGDVTGSLWTCLRYYTPSGSVWHDALFKGAFATDYTLVWQPKGLVYWNKKANQWQWNTNVVEWTIQSPRGILNALLDWKLYPNKL